LCNICLRQEIDRTKELSGVPATTVLGGTSFVTTLPAPTIAFSPMVTLLRIVAFEPIEALLYQDGLHFPILFALKVSVGVRRPGVGVVDEHDAVTDKNVVLDRHPPRR